MSTEKKKKFIIDVTYLALILVLSYLLLQYALPLLLPFVLAFLIAYVLRRPIRFLSRVLHAPKGLVAVLLVVLTYGTCLLYTSGALKGQAARVPFHQETILPATDGELHPVTALHLKGDIVLGMSLIHISCSRSPPC